MIFSVQPKPNHNPNPNPKPNPENKKGKKLREKKGVISSHFMASRESGNYFPVLLRQGPFELYHLVLTVLSTATREGLAIYRDRL